MREPPPTGRMRIATSSTKRKTRDVAVASSVPAAGSDRTTFHPSDVAARSAAAKVCAGGDETGSVARSGYAARYSAAFSGG